MAARKLRVASVTFWLTRKVCSEEVKVLPANITDRDGGQLLLPEVKETFPSIKHLFVDGGYKGKWAEWARETLGWSVRVVQRLPKVRGVWWPKDEPLPQHYLDLFEEQRKFKVILRRWIVERTLAWLSFQRRFNRDHEPLPETTKSFIRVAMIRLMVRRLAC